jgi:ABC-type antimicrobial peptide transport system permease subunit
VLGRHIRLGTSADYRSLVVRGVVSDAQADLSETEQTKPPSVYLDRWQYPQSIAGYPVMLLKTAGGMLPIGKVRQAVDRLGREYIDRARSLDSEKDGALVEDRVMAYLSAAFGVLALALAATGLFGLLSYHVANRTGEIGIRMALGARSVQIQWLVVRQIGGLLLGGSAAGVALSLLGGKAIAKMLFGVRPGDVRLLAGALAVLAATALVAAWLPARRAASVDPLAALRHE